jgi:transposase InsO family protein
MNEMWLTTREAAALLKISLRGIQKNAAKGNYQIKKDRTENGQTGYLIARSSLPMAAAPARKAKVSETSPDALSGCNQKQRAEAFNRLDILERWKGAAKEMKQSMAATANAFLEANPESQVSRTTLYRWKRDYREHGIVGLIPNWNNGKAAFDDDEFRPEAKMLAKQLYLKPSRPSYAAVFKLVQGRAILKGWRVPSYDTVKRYLQTIPAPARILLREGRKACEDKAKPAILRSLDGLAAMQIIESDHHQVDVAVVDRAGHVFFPWLTIWFDVRSRRPLGWILSSKPNSEGIRIAFMQTLMKYGIPQEVHIDNGKDYRAKIFRGENGRFRNEKTEFKNDLKPSLIEGIYGQLGIKVHWSIPYNAKTKVIERFFRTLRTEYSIWFRGYRGKNTMEKPEILAKQWRNGDVMPFDDFKLALEKWLEVEYSENRQHEGLGLRTPSQVFAETRIEKRTIGDEEMLWLCSEYPRRVKVGRDGIYLFNDYYWSEKLACEYLGEWVLVKYNDNDLSRIFVMNEKGVFIGMADKRNPGTWNMGADEYKKHMRLKKVVMESTMPEREIAAALSPADTEKLFLETIVDNGKKLPDVKERRIDTPFRHIIEEDKKESEERERLRAEAAEFSRQFATIPAGVPRQGERQRLDGQLEDFLKTYRRDS